jgi:hypothetical protein
VAKIIVVGDYVKFSPDRGNENPNGKTVLFGRVTEDHGDGTYALALNNKKEKLFVTPGDKLGMFKVIGKPKTLKDVPSDENNPYDPGTETIELV